MNNWREAGHPTARVIALIACPLVLLATFITMEITLASEINGASGFALGFRNFIYNTLLFPWFLGVLLGHWYHPFIERGDLDTRQFLIRTGIVAGVSMLGILPIGLLLLYLFNVHIPYYVNNIIVGLGFIFGLFVWPVRVFPIERGRI